MRREQLPHPPQQEPHRPHMSIRFRRGESLGTDDADRPPTPVKPKRFHGTVSLNSARVGRDASQIADEVIAHLHGLVGSQAKVTLEIDAESTAGFPETVVRTVTENSRTLKFSSLGFEKD